MLIEGKTIKTKAEMLIIANATTYGSGLVINPMGTIYDELFEVIVIKKISLFEVLKIIITKAKFNTQKTELYQTKALVIKSNKKAHFQIDGEYIGKVNSVIATLIPKAIYILVPNV